MADVRLRKYIQTLEALPVEEANNMVGCLRLTAMVGKAKKTPSASALEELGDEVDAVIVQAEQFVKCFKTSSNDLAKVTQKMKADLEKATTAGRQREDEKKRKRLVEEDNEARKRLALVKQSVRFTVDWARANHPAVEELDDLAAVQKKFAQAKENSVDPYEKPFVVKDQGVAEGVLKETVDKFLPEAVKHCAERCKDHTVSASKPEQGTGEWVSALAVLLPEKLQLEDSLPSTKQLVARTAAFCWMDSFVSCEWPAQFLGTVRWHFGGHCAYLLFSVADLEKSMLTLQPKKTATDEAMRTWVDSFDREGLTAEQLEAFYKAGLAVHHVRVEPGQCLVVPPGWLTACTALRQSTAVGVMKTFLCRGKATEAAFTVLARAAPDQVMVKATLDILALQAQ